MHKYGYQGNAQRGYQEYTDEWRDFKNKYKRPVVISGRTVRPVVKAPVFTLAQLLYEQKSKRSLESIKVHHDVKEKQHVIMLENSDDPNKI